MTAKTPAEREAWNAYMRAWRRSNPERARAHTKRGVAKFEAAHPLQTQARKRELQRRLVGAVGATSEKRCGPCQVCTLPTAELHWDHDHETGEFRGWLCHSCNVALGLFKDSPLILKSALQYLEPQPERRAA